MFLFQIVAVLFVIVLFLAFIASTCIVLFDCAVNPNHSNISKWWEWVAAVSLIAICIIGFLAEVL